MTPFKKGLISLTIIGSVLAPASGVFAQTYSTISAQVVNTNCPVLNYDLYYGMVNSDVVALQSFLAVQGYFHSTPIGVFGPLTYRAAQNFQAAHGIPATGYVGPLTRAVINSMQNCNNPMPPVPPPTPAPFIQNISPSSGTVGTSVTLSGYGFSNNSTVVFGGSGISNVYSNGSSLTFTIPEYTSVCPPGAYCIMMARQVTPGTYSIYVQNQNGTSNTVNFTVTSQATTQPLSITGLDAPASVRIGQAATWTLRTNVENYVPGSTLRYSVTWGDEGVYPTYASNASSPNIQTTASFTHTYLMAGTYRPTFTVTNDAGQTASATATVIVGY